MLRPDSSIEEEGESTQMVLIAIMPAEVILKCAMAFESVNRC